MQLATDHPAEGVLKIRPITMKHVTVDYVAWLNDPFVFRWLETRWVDQTMDTVRAYVDEAMQNKAVHLFAIEVDGKHIGNIKLGPINERHKCADVSYFIGARDQWGKGYATSAVRLVVERAFKDYGLHRVQAGAYEANGASRRVLRKAGFCEEGRLRQALRTDNGWSDHLLYGRCADAVAL